MGTEKLFSTIGGADQRSVIVAESVTGQVFFFGSRFTFSDADTMKYVAQCYAVSGK
jgi:hypothetical protein